MKKNPSILTSLIFIFVFSLFAFGCAEQKMMQPMDEKMEMMEQEPMSKEGEMEKPDMKNDMTDSMDKAKSM